MKKKYDVAAFIWPAFQYDKRAEIFWPKGIGEWEVVLDNKPKFEGHQQPRKPLWGYVNENDPNIMEMEIKVASEYGVNVFVYDWYWFDNRPFLEGCLNDGYLKARNNDKVKFYLMWANHDVNALWDKRLSDNIETSEVVWQASVSRAQFEAICNRLLERYLTHPSYYCIDGKPVFMIYDMNNLISGLSGIKETRDALEWFRNRAVQFGLKGLHLQCHFTKHTKPEYLKHSVEIAKSFDSNAHYHMCTLVDVNRDYLEAMSDMEKVWYEFSEMYPIPCVPLVCVGWDTNPRFNKLYPDIIKNNTPENFEKALLKAKAFLDAHPNQAPLLNINSWNEWTETGYLQPDDLYGYGYLEAVKRVFVD